MGRRAIQLRARSSDLDTAVRRRVSFTAAQRKASRSSMAAAVMPWKEPDLTPLTAQFSQGTETLEVSVVDLRPPNEFSKTPLPEVDPSLAARTTRRVSPSALRGPVVDVEFHPWPGWRGQAPPLGAPAADYAVQAWLDARAAFDIIDQWRAALAKAAGDPASRTRALGRRGAGTLPASQGPRRWTCGRGAGLAPRRGSLMDDFQIDARRWRFLDNPDRYIEGETGGLQVEPLTRQFKTAKEILSRLASGRGVLLADDVGLGKTTVSALVAWVVACQDKRVRIYAPNEVLRRRWAEELERHVPLLGQIGASSDRIKQGDVGKLNAGRIQVATHHALLKSHGYGEQRTACDLMIVDEAHRAKGDGSAFNEALRNLGDRAKRKLILTATPFSIRLTELEQLLQFVGASELEAVRRYAGELKRLYALGDGHDVTAESKRLVSAARAAIDVLQPYVIRHCIDDLSASERMHFGADGAGRWEIPTTTATQEDLCCCCGWTASSSSRRSGRASVATDPRFHVGWQHLSTELDRAAERAAGDADHVVLRHINKAKKSLSARRAKTHPKIAAVSDAMRPLLDAGEKVLVFCHHRATASELLTALERCLRAESVLAEWSAREGVASSVEVLAAR